MLLRFFENKSLAEVGSQLGTGEDTARKRIVRALESLQRYFNRRGVSSTTAILAGAIFANSVHAAPVGLAKTIAATAFKGPAVAISTLTLVKGTLKMINRTKLKFAFDIAAAVLFAGGTVTVAISDSNNTVSQPTNNGPAEKFFGEKLKGQQVC